MIIMHTRAHLYKLHNFLLLNLQHTEYIYIRLDWRILLQILQGKICLVLIIMYNKNKKEQNNLDNYLFEKSYFQFNKEIMHSERTSEDAIRALWECSLPSGQ